MSKATMQELMIRTKAALLVTLLSGCVAQPVSPADEAFSDFVAVSGLEPMDVARYREQFNTRPLTEHFALLQSRRDRYLVQFRHRCKALYETRFPADVRHERNALRAGIDTIRGCRIDRIFAVDESQAEELKLLANRLEDE